MNPARIGKGRRPKAIASGWKAGLAAGGVEDVRTPWTGAAETTENKTEASTKHAELDQHAR